MIRKTTCTCSEQQLDRVGCDCGHAYQLAAEAAGKRWAEGLKVGDEFAGAAPAAESYGYAHTADERSAFIGGALPVLERRGVWTKPDGLTITRIGE